MYSVNQQTKTSESAVSAAQLSSAGNPASSGKTPIIHARGADQFLMQCDLLSADGRLAVRLPSEHQLRFIGFYEDRFRKDNKDECSWLDENKTRSMPVNVEIHTKNGAAGVRYSPASATSDSSATIYMLDTKKFEKDFPQLGKSFKDFITAYIGEHYKPDSQV